MSNWFWMKKCMMLNEVDSTCIFDNCSRKKAIVFCCWFIATKTNFLFKKCDEFESRAMKRWRNNCDLKVSNKSQSMKKKSKKMISLTIMHRRYFKSRNFSFFLNEDFFSSFFAWTRLRYSSFHKTKRINEVTSSTITIKIRIKAFTMKI